MYSGSCVTLGRWLRVTAPGSRRCSAAQGAPETAPARPEYCLGVSDKGLVY